MSFERREIAQTTDGAAPGPEGAPALSVTVVTRNRASILRRCLAALAAQSLDPSLYEVIVVDDGSTDETPAAVEEARLRARCPMRFVRFDEHRGISAARNRSIAEARGSLVVFVDSDGMVPPSFLAVHLDAHQTSRGPIVCRGPIIRVTRVDAPAVTRPRLLDMNTSFFDTNNTSVGRDWLLRAGLFDEGQAHWEGLEMGVRLRRLGLRQEYRRSAPLFHYQPPLSADGFIRLLAREEERARDAQRFFARHPTLEVRLMTSQTALHRWLNLVQRAFGAVHPGNGLRIADGCARWGVPALGEVLLGGVLTGRYLAELQRIDRQKARTPIG